MRRSNGMLQDPGPPSNYESCIRCGEVPAVDELGYCGHCHWAVRAEIEAGMCQLRLYLKNWARFQQWECDRDHGDETQAA